MNLRHLQHFVILAETLHFGQAAKRLHMTQPPLSRQIIALEKSLGFQLFVRHSRSVALTPAGEHFYHTAKRLLDDFEFGVQAAQAVSRGERGELRIGFTMCAAWSILPELLAVFRESYPNVSIKLNETLPRDLQETLQRGDIDIGISFPMAQAQSLSYQPMYQEALCAVLPSDHPLAQVPQVSVGDLADESFVTFPAATAPELHQAFMACCHRYHVEPDIRLETHLQQTIVNLVAKGLGVSLVPDSMRRMQLEGVIFKPLEYSVQVEQGIFWNTHNLNPCLQPFLACADGWYRKQKES